jgi:hypothetical protein
MNTILLVAAILGALGSLGTLFGTLVICVVMEEHHQKKMKRWLKAAWSHSTRGLAVLLVLGASGASVSEIYLLAADPTVPTRADFLVLLMHCWNAFSYFFFGMVLFAFWMKDVLAKEYPVGSQT